MREGVTVGNLKTDSKSEFGGSNTAEEREQSARGASEANGQAWCPRVSHMWHTPAAPLCPRVPHVDAEFAAADWSLLHSLEIF